MIMNLSRTFTATDICIFKYNCRIFSSQAINSFSLFSLDAAQKLCLLPCRAYKRKYINHRLHKRRDYYFSITINCVYNSFWKTFLKASNNGLSNKIPCFAGFNITVFPIINAGIIVVKVSLSG